MAAMKDDCGWHGGGYGLQWLVARGNDVRVDDDEWVGDSCIHPFRNSEKFNFEQFNAYGENNHLYLYHLYLYNMWKQKTWALKLRMSYIMTSDMSIHHLNFASDTLREIFVFMFWLILVPTKDF